MLTEEERKEMLAHPFKRMRDKVALVGFSQKTRHMAPYEDDSYEIWGLNEEYNWYPKSVDGVMTMESWLKRYDRWFQLHPRADFMRLNNTNDRNHPLWLHNTSGECMWCKGTLMWENYMNGGKKEPCPFCKDGVFTPNEKRENLIIYMQESNPDIPGSVKYPLKEISQHLIPENMRKSGRDTYFRSSPAFMFALALAMGYKTIAVYGFEMGTDTEYHYQRANFEYWIGQAQGRGVTVEVPADSSLLKGELYGYDTLKVGYRQDLEMRKLFLEAMVKKSQSEMDKAEGAYYAIRDLFKATGDSGISGNELKKAVEKAKLAFTTKQGMKNFKMGAEKEVEMQMKMFDAYYNSETRENVEKTEQLVNTDYVFSQEEYDKRNAKEE